MKCQQICYLLLENAQNEDSFVQAEKLESFDIDPSTVNDMIIKSRLHKILATLQEQKNEFISHQSQQHQILVEKIHNQKDQIIENLVKNIYSLKKQNDQLRFQYRKRFKVIKNMQEKYENLITGKNKKISELESVVKYLEGKIKHLQKQIGKYEGQLRKEISTSRGRVLSKSPQTYLSPNKISLIKSKEKLTPDPSKYFLSKNSTDDLTMPLTTSLVSSSKATSSSKTVSRNRSKEKYNKMHVSNFVDAKESDVYSSFLELSEKNFNEKCIETETNFEDNSRITPICLDKRHSLSISKDLTMQDFNDIERNDLINGDISSRNPHRDSQKFSRDRWNFLREHY